MKHSNILFEYRCSSADCSEEGVDSDGFSVTIYKDGKAEYRTYIFSNIPKKYKKFEINKKLLEEIELLFEINQEKILTFDNNIDNGSCDGVFNIFTFNGKKITTLNIDTYNLKKVKNKDFEYYKEYYGVMVQENEIMEIFNKLCMLLRKYHIYLTLDDIHLPLITF